MLRSLLFFILILLSLLAFPCSVALLKGQHSIVAHNLDWPYLEGIGAIHPRGEAHHAEVDNKTYIPLSWNARYGNVIFHGSSDAKPVYGSADGMNERGLFASILILKHSQYPLPSIQRPVLDTTHWVQYMLDNFQSVEEVLAAQAALQMVANIYKAHPMALHLYVADEEGHQAVVEYLEGKLVIHREEEMPEPLLTNDAYDNAIRYLKEYQGFGGNKPLPGGYSSEARFVRLASFLKRTPKNKISEYAIPLAFSILNDSAEAPYTPMQTIISDVYDLTHHQIFYKTILNHRIRTIDLNKIDFSTLKDPIYFKIHTDQVNATS